MQIHEAELKELRHGLTNIVRTGLSELTDAATAAGAALPSHISEAKDLLHKLGDQMSELVDDAEDLVASHPASSVAAAFLLGVAVGRMTKRG